MSAPEEDTVTERLCKLEGCSKPAARHQRVCSMHRARMERHGNYDGVRPEGPAPDRFEKYVDRTDACWTWTGALNNNGYGRFWGGPDTGMIYAHRWSYLHHVGPVGDKHVLHKCDNPRCVAPQHLFLGTPADNAHDKVLKGRALLPKCRSGLHEWTPENTEMRHNGVSLTRSCRACREARRAA